MLHNKFNQVRQLNFLSKKVIHVKEKVRYVLNYLETFKAVHKNHPRTHSLPQNKKAVLMTAAYFKVSTAVRSQGQQLRFIYLRLPKKVFSV